MWGVSAHWIHVAVCKLSPWRTIFQEFTLAEGEDLELSGVSGDELALKVMLAAIFSRSIFPSLDLAFDRLTVRVIKRSIARSLLSALARLSS